MEAKINIADILKDKPKGTMLYSILSDGECFLNDVSEDKIYIDIDNRERFCCLSANGSTYSFPNGGVLLFPSNEMRDWEKFTWKKGDLLVNSCGFQCIFKEWASDDYTKFNGCYSNSRDGYEDVSNAETAKFYKLDHNIAYGYVREIERKLGGKLNLETLEIEPAQPEFKDGDIAYADYGNKQAVFIVSGKTDLSEGYNSFIALDLRGLTLDMGCMCFFKNDLCKLRLATEEEKQQLFSALAKEGKAWDSEEKQVVDLKPKVELKPFDKVLIRDSEGLPWRVSLFGYKDANSYYCCNGCTWNQCIPYEGNESLLGTTKDVEG